MALSEAKKLSNDRYLQKLEDIKLRVPKGTREQISEHARGKGMSLNAYVLQLIEKDMDVGGFKSCR